MDTDVVILAVHFVGRIPCDSFLVAYAEHLGPQKRAGTSCVTSWAYLAILALLRILFCQLSTIRLLGE